MPLFGKKKPAVDQTIQHSEEAEGSQPIHLGEHGDSGIGFIELDLDRKSSARSETRARHTPRPPSAPPPEDAPPDLPPSYSEHMLAMSSTAMSDVSDLGQSTSFFAMGSSSSSDAAESWYHFFKSVSGLPYSCRRFLLWSCVCVGLIIVHSIFVLLGILTIPYDSTDPVAVAGGLTQRTKSVQMLALFGGTQFLYSCLTFYFAIFALRRENQVELSAALYLVLSLLVYDISVLITPAFSNNLGTSGLVPDSAGPYVTTLMGPNFRGIWLVVVIAFYLPMLYYGSRARVDFGWRIFKLCGTNLDLKRVYERLFALKALFAFDFVLFLQNMLFASFALMP